MSKFDTHGGYFAPQGYVRINEGGTHEENPDGGVQFGVDDEGTPNVLEENESIYQLENGQDFVYSNRVVITKDMIDQFNLNPWAEGLTYAEYVDKIVDESDEHPLDPIENNGMRAILSRAAQAQETQKIIDEQAQIEQELSELSPEELNQLEAMFAEQEAQGQQAEISPEEVAMMQQPAAMPMMSRGGTLLRRYDLGGYVDDDIPPVQRDNIRVFNPIQTWESKGIEVLPINAEGISDSRAAWNDFEGAAGSLWDVAHSFIPGYDTVADAIHGRWDSAWNNLKWDMGTLALGPLVKWAKGAKGVVRGINAAEDAAKTARSTSKTGKAVRAASGNARFEQKASESLAEKMGRITESEVQAAARRNTSKAAGSAAETLAKTKATAITQLDDEAAVLQKQLSAATEKLAEAQARSASKMEIDGIQREIKALERKLKDNADQAAYIGKRTAPEVKSATPTPKPEPKPVPEPVVEKPAATTSQAPAAKTPTTPAAEAPAPAASETVAPKVRDWHPVRAGIRTLIHPTGITRTLNYNLPKGLGAWKYPIGAAELAGRTFGAIATPHLLRNYQAGRAVRQYMNTPIFETDFEYPFNGDTTSVIWNSDYQEPAANDIFYAKGGPVNKYAKGDPVFRINPSFTIPAIKPKMTLPGWNINTGTPGNVNPEDVLPTGFTSDFSSTHNIDGTPKFNGLSVELDPNLFPTGKLSPKSEPVTEKETAVPAALSTWPRYSGIINAGIAGIHNMLQKPDELKVPTYSPALGRARMHLRDMVFNPVDQNMAVQDVVNSGAGTARALNNSGYGPSVGRALLALDSGIGRNMGTARGQVADINQGRYNQVMNANNQNAATLGQFQYGISRDNASIENAIMRERIQNELFRQRYNDAAESEKYAAIQTQLDALAQALSGIGRENFVMNQINSNTALPYGVGLNGLSYFTGARGGLLKKIK